MTPHQFADRCRQLSVGQTLRLPRSDAEEMFGSTQISDVAEFLALRLGSPEHSGLQIQETGDGMVVTRLRLRNL